MDVGDAALRATLHTAAVNASRRITTVCQLHPLVGLAPMLGCQDKCLGMR
jgi:hypothetical protein